MKNQLHLIGGLIISLLVFNLVFWNEGLGLNLLLFSLLNFGLTFYLVPALWNNKYSKLLAAGTLLLAIFVVVHHSVMSMVIYFISYFIFIGFSFFHHQHQMALAGIKGIYNLIYGPIAAIKKMTKGASIASPFRRGFYYFQLILIPLFILTIFLLLYSQANEHVAYFTGEFFDKIFSFIGNLSFARIFFFLLSFILVSASMIPHINPAVVAETAIPEQQLVRSRRAVNESWSPFSMIGLKGEYRIAVLSFLCLNLLLLFVNILDFLFVWTGKTNGGDVSLKSHVHEGTFTLIFSILLAMVVLLIFFRRNLNFFPNNDFLKKLAYAWIIQNAILVISVGIRNYQYITWHGLAYKRIGVIIFLVLVIFGLWTMYEKVRFKHRLNYVLRKNSWAVYIAFIFCAGINWDTFITRYNLTHDFRGEINVRFLFNDVSDKNFKLLKEKEQELYSIPSYPIIKPPFVEEGLFFKQMKFADKMRERSWLSWNFPDYKTRKYMREKGLWREKIAE